ncbi:PDZ domain-containing protein [Pseudonocardia sp. KRD-184]|uniref:Tricorn protease homolog n=3 Tax=Pseudonocardia oceani TaxID=2792013 RepID=A0ABS6UBK0_9PSEU|nr:S41 family peptidase [Pseudonocardia oceani]MBW0096225.1 PDZ domain-containing protein [Pseudonocardia oceani]MBW0122311.1 PDZ domain-containing protein [Pseudonocardia oceani]MBW0129616.1 PDZ domain-containing protein [Pseudonocardia oceani]
MPQPSYLRFPHLRDDTLVLAAEDDVWTVPIGGGRAHRVTADAAPVANPRISPDGTRVAWTSWREGGPDVFVTALDGGVARRLTWWGDPRARNLGWAGDDALVGVTSTGYHSTRRTFAFTVPAAGGAPVPLPVGPVGDLVRDDTGTLVLSVLSREPAWWKRYRGGTAGKLWWDAGSTGEFTRVAADVDGQIEAPMLVGGRLAFVADHEGWGNVYSIAPDGSDLRRHTDHGGPGAPAFYVRHATSDGERIVYESAGRLWLLESLDAEPRPIDVRLGGPRTARAPHRVAGRVDVAVPDRTGRTSIALLRGTVHRLTHRDGPARTLLSEPGARARLARPLGTDRAVWVDDVLGEDAVCVAPLDPRTGDAPTRTGAGELGRVLGLAPSPDGARVALTTHDGRLLLLDTATAELTELTRSADGVELTGLTWSPDSAWLALAEPVEQVATRIVLARVADGELVPVTPPRFLDRAPAFTLDGRYLAFLSRRSFDPIYDEHSFDLTFPASWRPFLVPLAARTPSPFGASPDGRPVAPGDEGPEDPPAPGPDDPSSPDAAAVPAPAGSEVPDVLVDVVGLAERVVPVPVVEARYGALAAGKDCLLWLRSPVNGVLGDGRAGTSEKARRTVLERFDLVRRKLDVIADAVDGYSVSGDGTRLLVRDGKTLRVLRTDRSGSGAPEGGEGADEYEVDLSRLAVTVDPTASWRQMFDEAARLMRDHFWTADMADVDWAAEQERYRPLVDAVGSHDDLVDLLWEFQGELGSSHAYVRPRPQPAGDAPAFLGADLAATPDGWRVERVLPPETSAPAARSPLAAPGVDVRAGDVLLEVAGRPVDPDLGPAPLLAGTADVLTEITVRSGDAVRRVVVRPLHDEDQLRYQDWVAGRRAFVTERSGGRLGYLHVPDMMATGWAQLHRDLSLAMTRDGLVLDVRINGGGHTSQLVVEKLARRVTAWTIARHRPPRTYPMDAPRGPVVAVADELAGSDGDIVTVALKRRGIATVVGVRTWGGVIGIDSRYGLVDGTGVTQPRYSHWFDDLGWDVENHGVEPDVEVVVTPQDWAAGRDPQLERAVDLALEALERTPPVQPPDIATRPSRRRPDLPPRTPS